MSIFRSYDPLILVLSECLEDSCRFFVRAPPPPHTPRRTQPKRKEVCHRRSLAPTRTSTHSQYPLHSKYCTRSITTSNHVVVNHNQQSSRELVFLRRHHSARPLPPSSVVFGNGSPSCQSHYRYRSTPTRSRWGRQNGCLFPSPLYLCFHHCDERKSRCCRPQISRDPLVH